MAVQIGVSENEDVKKKALLRLAVAGLVTATALAGLWWLDQGKSGKPAPAPSPTLPAPITPAPPLDAAPPQTEAAPLEPGEDAAPRQEAAAPPEAPDRGVPRSAPEPPPPPMVSNLPRPPAPQPAPATPARPPSPPALPVTTPTAPPGTGFVVQLGVFSNPDNARELVDKLTKLGIRAHMETRVQIGPFLNRGEAEKAQAEMRRLGYTPLVTPASATR